jgi:putative ABC transport system substrate-binding protein
MTPSANRDCAARRRSLLLAFGIAFVAGPGRSRAQTQSTKRVRRVGVLTPSTRDKEEINLKPFYDQMRKLGWMEEKNIAYDKAYGDDRHDRLAELAAGLVARKVELIFAPPASAASAARNATQTIPIVFSVVPDPISIGLVKSLAHPGTNATGLSSFNNSLEPKRVELLREIIPGARRIGLVGDPGDPNTALDEAALAPLVSALGLAISFEKATNAEDFDAALVRLAEEPLDAILATSSALAFNLRRRVIELARAKRVPVVGVRSQWADDGALFSYGASQDEQLRRSAEVVDKILRGVAPADIPVEQPTQLELVLNVKAARALGLTIPQSFLLRADRIIQ